MPSPMRSIDLSKLKRAGLLRVGAPLQLQRLERPPRRTRFVTQSHALGRPKASPLALMIAAAVAIAVYLLGCRLSD